ncbi:MAG: YitT family protein [Paludibacteraceae bacterium]|nr:YitT family protein [Paludibacteraceae bacterium]
MNGISQYFSAEFWQSILTDFCKALRTKKFYKELVLMTLGMLIGAASVYYFLMPSHLIVGSISGLSIVLNTLFGGTADTFSLWVTGINAFLLLLAFILIGNEFGAKTVYTALILGPLVQFWDRVLPNTTFTHKAIEASPELLQQLQAGQTVLDANGNPYLLSRAGEVLMQVKDSVMSAGVGMGDVWFDLVCFVLLLSICQTLEFSINASTGGLDILAKIINKYLHFDIGISVTIGGALICSTAFFINDFRMVVVGLIGTWINGMVVNYFTATINNRKRVCIISHAYEPIHKFIKDDLVRGCTLYNVTGGCTGEPHTEIQSLLTQNEFAALMHFIHEHNYDAFITAGNCSEVYGLWAHHKKNRKSGRVELSPEDRIEIAEKQKKNNLTIQQQ